MREPKGPILQWQELNTEAAGDQPSMILVTSEEYSLCADTRPENVCMNETEILCVKVMSAVGLLGRTLFRPPSDGWEPIAPTSVYPCAYQCANDESRHAECRPITVLPRARSPTQLLDLRDMI